MTKRKRKKPRDPRAPNPKGAYEQLFESMSPEEKAAWEAEEDIIFMGLVDSIISGDTTTTGKKGRRSNLGAFGKCNHTNTQ